jgi:P4 family phage/plasmid primase-like protien
VYQGDTHMSDPTIASALDVARGLAAGGIPIFLARPAGPEDAEHWQKVGFVLPKGWQATRPDPAVVDHWRSGMALCAVMGHGLDLLDIDPRSGGALPPELVDDISRTVHAGATTPSDGFHLFITSLGVGSRDGVFPGVDVKGGGDPDKPGGGHGFAFLAPTVKISKATGQPGEYRWTQPPGYRAVPPGRAERLAAAVLAVKGTRTASVRATTPADDPLAHYVHQREPHSTLVADRVIAAKLEELAAQPAQPGAGFRTALLNAAMTLGGYVGAGHLAEPVAYEYLCDAVTDVWGQANADDELWITQGLTDGAQRPFAVYAPHEAVAGPGAPAPEDERKWQFYDVIGVDPFDPHQGTSDQELADQVLARVYPGLRAGVDTGSWIVRGPEVWEEAEDMAAWAISAVARLMPLGRKAEAGEDKGPEHWQYERRKLFLSAAGAGRVARKMRDITRGADHFATVRVSALDADPEILWAGGVPWDLRASGDRPALAEWVEPGTPHLHTAKYVPEPGPTPAWDAFLATVWPDPEVRAWALRVLSIAFTGYPDAALPVLLGVTRSGKSSLITLIMDVLGTYAHAADARILAGAENTHASVIYALKGRRLSFVDEGPRKGHLATERLKQITGGAPLTGNAMRSNPVTFLPTHTLVMSTNPENEPQISDAAMRARIRIIPCDGDLEAVRRAREALTPAVWAAEAPAVLAAFMREAAGWLAHRDTALTEAAPLSVRTQRDELAAAQDVFAEWVEARTTPDETGTRTRELYHAFAAWHGDHPAHRKQSPPTETAFGRALNRLGLPLIHRSSGNFRALRLSAGNGEWGPFITAPQQPAITESGATVTVEGTVRGIEGSTAEPFTSNFPSSDPIVTMVDEGLKGTTPNTNPKQNTHSYNKNTGEIGDKPITLQAPAERPPSASSVVDGMYACGQCPEHVGATKAGKLRAHKNEAGFKCEGSGAKVPGFVTESQKAKAAERTARIEQLAGPVIGLPAAMRRGEDPRAVDPAAAAAVIRAALERNAGMLSVDIETNALPPWHPDFAVRTIQLGDWAEGVVLDATDAEHRALAAVALAQAAEIDAYSYTADLAPLAKLGVIDYAAALAKAVDTATIAKLADPAHTGNGDGLKDVAATVLGQAAIAPGAEDAKDAYFAAAGWISQLKPDTPEDKNGWRYADHTRATMIRYGIADVLDCSALRLKLPQPDPALLARERRIQRVVAPLPLHGVKLAAEAVSEQLRDREPRAARRDPGTRRRQPRLAQTAHRPFHPARRPPAAHQALEDRTAGQPDGQGRRAREDPALPR